MHPRSYRLKFPEPAPSESDNSFSGRATPSVLRVRPASPPPKGPPKRKDQDTRPRSHSSRASCGSRHMCRSCHCSHCARKASPRPLVAESVVIIDPEDHNQRIIDAGPGRPRGGGSHRHDPGRRARGGARHRSASAQCGARAGAAATAGGHRGQLHAAGFHRAARWPAARDQAQHQSLRRLARVVPASARCLSCRSACSPASAPSRISHSRPPRSPRSWRRVAARVVSSPIRACCPRDSSPCHWPCCAGPRNRMRVSWPWACAPWVSSCGCRAPGLPGVSARSCSPIWTACWDAAPIRARGWRAASVIGGARFRSRNRGSRAHPAGARALAGRARAFPARAPARRHGAAMPLPPLPRGADALHVAVGRARGQRRKIHATAARTSRHARLCPSPCGAASCAAARSPHRAAASQPLWSPGERGHASAGEMPALVEHLRARLGDAAVYGIGARIGTSPRKRLVRGRTVRKMGTSLFNDEAMQSRPALRH